MELPPHQEAKEPLYPLLDVSELGKELPDLRHMVSREIQAQLSPDDTVVHVVTPEIKELTKENRYSPSALREILRLTNVAHPTRIGENGAAIAGLSSQENSSVAALRKFEVVHGRDALEIALKLHNHYPRLLRATILELASTQGLEDETPVQGQPFRQEERGRIILLDRGLDDPVGRKFSNRLNWGHPFYGSIDATPTFISAVSHYTLTHDAEFLQQPYTGKDGQQYRVADALVRSVKWLQKKLDTSDSGFLEFKNTALEGGMSTQSWKDSAFAYIHADGTRANHDEGIASIEVQAFAYDALLDSARAYHKQGDNNKADELKERANTLRHKIINTFWVDDPEKGGFFAMATDYDTSRNLRTLKVRSSNMGRLLNSQLLDSRDSFTAHLKESVVAHLFSPELLSYSGIRTLASDEAAYRPGGYHTGSVWLWDSASIADGLERQGYHHLAWNLRERLWRTVEETRQFPEFVRGDSEQKVEMNKSEVYVWNDRYKVLHLFEQPPQEVQGWTVSALLAAKFAYPQYNAQRNNLPTSPFEQSILKRL